LPRTFVEKLMGGGLWRWREEGESVTMGCGEQKREGIRGDWSGGRRGREWTPGERGGVPRRFLTKMGNENRGKSRSTMLKWEAKLSRNKKKKQI